MSIDKKALIEERVNTALLGQWYPVAKSVEAKTTKPHGATLQGQKLVLWRKADGSNNCIGDFCPHRSASLSYGEIHQRSISCCDHGEGVVVHVTGQTMPVNNGYVFGS